MRRLPKQSVITISAAAALGVILLVLAVLQYQWSGRISQAERQRLEAGLRAAMSQFRQEFNRELQRLAQACQLPPAVIASRDWQSYAERMGDWIHAAPEAQLVTNLYLWVSGDDAGSQLLKLNRESVRFDRVPWPSHLDGVRERYARAFAGPMRSLPEFRPFAWRTVPEIPLLIAPLVETRTADSPPSSNLRLAGFLIVEVSLDFLRTGFPPEIAHRHFGEAESSVHQAAIIGGRNPCKVIYGSDPSLAPSAFASPDARISLVGDPRALFARRAAGGGRPDAVRPPFEAPPNCQPRLRRDWRRRGRIECDTGL